MDISYHFAIRQILNYHYEYSSSTHTDLRMQFAKDSSGSGNAKNDIMGLKQDSQLTLRADLKLVVRKVTKTGFRLIFNFENISADMSVNEVKEPYSAQLKAGLSRPILADMESHGRISACYFDPAISRIAQGVCRTLIAKTQFVLPGDGNTESGWQTTEEDPDGICSVKYQPVAPEVVTEVGKPQGRWAAFLKTKESCQVQTDSTNKSQPQRKIFAKGRLVVGFSELEGRLIWVAGSEEEEVAMGPNIIGTGKSSVKLALTKSYLLDESDFDAICRRATEAVAESIPVPLFWRPSEKQIANAVDRNILGMDTSNSLLSELEISEAKGESSNTKLVLKFRSLIDLQPKCVDDLAVRMTAAPPRSLTRRVLVDALGASGSEEAQRVLADIARSGSIDSQFRVQLIQRLGMTPMPTRAAENALRELAQGNDGEGVKASAIANLGAMARSLSSSNPSCSRNIIDWLLRQANESISENKLNYILMALGNSGSLDALPILTRFCSSSSSTIRATAVGALRWIESDKADQRISEILQSDPDSSVRITAMIALNYRKPAPVTIAAQKTLLSREQVAGVRIMILRNLWKTREAIPDLTQIVRSIAANDPSDEVRKVAEGLLGERDR